MNNNFMKAAVFAAVFGLLAAGNAAASISMQDSTMEAAAQDNDYQKLQDRLNTFKEKVQKSSKDDAAALFEEAKTIKAEIAAANVSKEELQELQKTFNGIIDLCKNLK